MTTITKHSLVAVTDGVQCRLCLRTWSSGPRYECPGVPHLRWEAVPPDLQTKTALRKLKLKPAGPARGVCYSKRQGWIWLYSLAEAQARPEATPAQLAALERGRATAAQHREEERQAEIAAERAEWEAEEQEHREDCQRAARGALQLLDASDWVVLDTETTGLGDAELVEIAVLAPDGTTLLDTLVRPTIPILIAATMIHGIRDQDVAGAPTFPDIYPALADCVRGRRVVVYNASFDHNILSYCCALHRLPKLPVRGWVDAMAPYAAWVNDWSDYWGNYKWQPLPSAGHRAADDCRAVLRIIKLMAEDATSAKAH